MDDKLNNKEIKNFLDFFESVDTDMEKTIEDKIQSVNSIEEEEKAEVVKESIKEEEIIVEEKLPTYIEEDKYYSVYKDISENFTCDVLVEGSTIDKTSARLILESDEWTIVFSGDIDRNGKCNIPIKKLDIFNEGLIGNIKLEIIAEGSVFVPWEDKFKVKFSKKVTAKVNENAFKPTNKVNTSVKVTIDKK